MVLAGFGAQPLDQSRSASGVYTITYYVGTDANISEVLHVAGEKGGTGASAKYAIQDIFRFLAH